jgi:hypothetical protein
LKHILSNIPLTFLLHFEQKRVFLAVSIFLSDAVVPNKGKIHALYLLTNTAYHLFSDRRCLFAWGISRGHFLLLLSHSAVPVALLRWRRIARVDSQRFYLTQYGLQPATAQWVTHRLSHTFLWCFWSICARIRRKLVMVCYHTYAFFDSQWFAMID